MSWWETYAGWRAHRGKIEALGLLPVIAAAAWEIFFVQWNANQIAYVTGPHRLVRGEC